MQVERICIYLWLKRVMQLTKQCSKNPQVSAAYNTSTRSLSWLWYKLFSRCNFSSVFQTCTFYTCRGGDTSCTSEDWKNFAHYWMCNNSVALNWKTFLFKAQVWDLEEDNSSCSNVREVMALVKKNKSGWRKSLASVAARNSVPLSQGEAVGGCTGAGSGAHCEQSPRAKCQGPKCLKFPFRSQET